MSEELVLTATDGTSTNSISHAVARYNAVKLLAPVAPTASAYAAFLYIPMPAQLASRTVLSAYVDVVMESQAGSRSLTLVRHPKPATTYTSMTHDNKPAGSLAGAPSHTVTQVGTTTVWRFDVTADLISIAAGGAYYGWKLTSSYTSAWKMAAWQSSTPPKLTVTLAENSTPPLGLRPNGVTGLAKPVLTWNAAKGLVSAKVQIDAVGGTFTAPVFSSPAITTTEGQIDLAATTYAGLANGASADVRILQTTDAGDSAWSDRVTITRQDYPVLTITGPASPSTDPTPALTWTFTPQVKYRVTVTNAAGVVIADSGDLPGGATAWAPSVGATASGDVLTYRLRTVDRNDRTTSPGDLGYVEATTTITYTPGTATAASTFTAVQDGVKPWVNLAWTLTAGAPDEWLIIRDGVIVDRVAGLSGGAPVLSYRDYSARPNRAQVYTIRPFSGGAAGAAATPVTVTPYVTGAWLIDTATGEHFSITGDALSLGYSESSVIYFPVGRATPVKRTFALRGIGGNVSGILKDFDGRTVAQQEAALHKIKAATTDPLRYVDIDTNIPVVASDLSPALETESSMIYPAASRNRVLKTVSFTIQQAGELPFPEVVP